MLQNLIEISSQLSIPSENFASLKDIHIKADNKIAETFYNRSILSREHKDTNIPNLIYKTFERLLQDSTFKYFLYISLLEDKKNASNPSYIFCGVDYECYSNIFEREYSIDAPKARYHPEKGIMTVSLDINRKFYPLVLSNMAHEFVHKGYNKIYNNGAKAYSSGDSIKETDFKLVYQNTLEHLKQSNQEVNKLIYDGIFLYPKTRQEEEMLAMCQQFKFHNILMNNLSYEVCPEITKFFELYVVPDIVTYIEHHPHCQDIYEFDNSTNCVVGEATHSQHIEVSF